MLDKVSLQRIELLHPKLRTEAKKILEEASAKLTGDYTLRFTHTLRTHAEQDKLYAQGRTVKGSIVTNARGGQSYHNYGLAIDICLLSKDGTKVSWDANMDSDKDGVADWLEIVAVFKKYGWEWGGNWRFRDMPHFQKTFGQTISSLQNKYKVQKTPYVSI